MSRLGMLSMRSVCRMEVFCWTPKFTGNALLIRRGPALVRAIEWSGQGIASYQEFGSNCNRS